MGYTTLNKDEKEEEKKVLILFTPTFLPFGQEVSLAQRVRSIPIRNQIYIISKFITKLTIISFSFGSDSAIINVIATNAPSLTLF